MDSKPEFKIGDRVVIQDLPTVAIGMCGKTATIVQEEYIQGWCEISVDDWPFGHDGSSGDAARRNRWFIEQCNLAPLTPVPLDKPHVNAAVLPTDSKARKEIPLMGGLLDYFPSALVAVARISKKGNDKHNPGEPLHWSRDKSTDHLECIMRHLLDYDKLDEDGELHIDHVIWRACALSQLMKEAKGAPKARGAK